MRNCPKRLFSICSFLIPHSSLKKNESSHRHRLHVTFCWRAMNDIMFFLMLLFFLILYVG
jgi:hypothetical protein